MTKKKIIVLVGPSGSGKTSIGEVLTKRGIPRLVTTTTRPPRESEKNGVDYYFRDFSEVEMDEFVEQTVYNGNRYGLTRAEVNSMLEKFDVVHVSLDRHGAEAVKEVYPKEAFVIFVPISEEEMIRRMQLRGDSPAEINERIAFSRKTNELTPPPDTDLIVENIEVEETAEKIIHSVLFQENNQNKEEKSNG